MCSDQHFTIPTFRMSFVVLGWIVIIIIIHLVNPYMQMSQTKVLTKHVQGTNRCVFANIESQML